MNILFRADSSSTIGTGHIMRDLVLTNEFKNDTIIFATQDLPGNINHKIQEKNFQIELLDSNELDELDTLIKKYKINILVIDHYKITYEFEKKIKEQNQQLRLFVLDDTYEKHFCDILLNHNIYAQQSRYKDLVPNQCELRCGLNHTLLREEFVLEKSVKRDRKSILVALGGADSRNLNIKVLKELQGPINVVTTTANQHLEELKLYVENKENIHLHINSNEIAKLINESYLCVVTPSVVLNEVFYLKSNFIAIKTEENQSEMYDYLHTNDYEVYKDFEDFSNRIKIKNFINLDIKDKELILQWRNSDNIREWMYNKDLISLEQHLNYIEKLKILQDRVYFLVYKDNNPVGVIDLTSITSESAEIGLYTKPDSKGFGTILVEEIIKYGFTFLGLKTLQAVAYEENTRAIYLYEKCGFKIIKKNEFINMELKNEDR